MSYQYVVRSKKDKTGGEEKVRYYGVPVVTGQILTSELAEEVADRCSLTRGDVLAAISELSAVMKMWLSGGYSVNLDRIGSFSLSASSPGCVTPEECTPGKVKAQRVCFKASPDMRDIVEKIKFEKKK